MPKKQISKEKSIKRSKLITEIVISVVLLGSCVYLIKGAADRSQVIAPSEYVEKTPDSERAEPSESPQPPQPPQPDPTGGEQPTTMVEGDVVYDVITPSPDNRGVNRGDQILVNDEYEYIRQGGEKLVSILEKNDETDRDSFLVSDYDCQIIDRVYEPLALMMDAFYEETDISDVMVSEGYRTTAKQQELYDEFISSGSDDDSYTVAKAGHSEHETGYAIDLAIYNEDDETVSDFDGKGDYSWISENCYKYGFVVRYTKDKEKVTGMKADPGHLRYVGMAHAYYMHENDLCLEEYIDLLREHTYEGEHLKFKDDSDAHYEVYFIKSDESSNTTTISKRSGKKFELSGNNSDGFIVTIYEDIDDDGTDLPDPNSGGEQPDGSTHPDAPSGGSPGDFPQGGPGQTPPEISKRQSTNL